MYFMSTPDLYIAEYGLKAWHTHTDVFSYRGWSGDFILSCDADGLWLQPEGVSSPVL